MGRTTERRIVTRFAVSGLVALLTAAAIGFALARRNATANAKGEAEAQTRLVAAMLAQQLEPADLVRPVGPLQAARLDTFFRSSLPDAPLVRIFGRSGLVTYSTDHALIGTSPQWARQKAAAAVAGGASSSISRLEDGLKVIGATAPLDPNRDGRRDGAIEIYRDFGPVAADIRSDVLLRGTSLAILLLLLYAALLPILRRVLGERSRIEDALDATELRHRSLVAQLPLATYVRPLGPLDALEWMSPQIEPMLGWPVEEWTTNPSRFIDSVHPDDRERVFAAAQQFRASRGRFSEEYRLVARDGRVVWVLDETSVVCDESGRARHLQGVLIDVTERRLGQETLRESEQRFRGAFDSSALGMALTSREGGIMRANDVLCEILGYERDELVGMSFSDITHPEDRRARRSDLDRLRADGVGAYQAERRYVRKDGQVVWCRVSASAIQDEGGSALYDITQFQDVSAERALRRSLEDSERRFRALFEESHVSKVVIDDDGAIVDCNPAYCELVGIDRGKLRGRRLHEFSVHGAPGEDLLEAITSGAPVPVQLIREDGQQRELDVSAKRNVLPGRHLVVMVDLTEQRRLEDQVRQSQKMESVGRLAGGIAHDFNNLLTAITGYTELMLRRIPAGDPLRRDASEIRVAAERATNLTRQLLAFSRRQVLQPRLLDLNTVVVEMEKMLQRLIGEDVSLETLLEPELGAVRADPGQLEQVILNLAVNARDALPLGGKLTIETTNVELEGEEADTHVGGQAGSYVLLTISDNGHGMDESTRAQLFEPFFTTKDGEGTGLGLATVYGIVKQSDGYIWVDSEPGAGSCFRVYLPRVLEAAAVPPVEDRPAAHEAPQGAETILLVEDEEIVRDLVKEMLTGFGYDVLEARNGREAIDVSRDHAGPIHLLISDVIMPGISGPEASREVVAQRPETRVLFISGYTDSAIVHHGVLEPGTEFLQKPFNSETLARKVRSVLDGAALARAS